jgi:hypothetical protein
VGSDAVGEKGMPCVWSRRAVSLLRVSTLYLLDLVRIEGRRQTSTVSVHARLGRTCMRGWVA